MNSVQKLGILNTVCQNKGPTRCYENRKIQRSFQCSFGSGGWTPMSPKISVSAAPGGPYGQYLVPFWAKSNFKKMI